MTDLVKSTNLIMSLLSSEATWLPVTFLVTLSCQLYQGQEDPDSYQLTLSHLQLWPSSW